MKYMIAIVGLFVFLWLVLASAYPGVQLLFSVLFVVVAAVAFAVGGGLRDE